jgi:hypothetical protein
MVYSLTHLNFSQALAENPLLLMLLPYLCYSWLSWLLDSFNGPHIPRLHISRSLVLSSAILLLTFAIIRNLPWPPFQFLAPHIIN